MLLADAVRDEAVSVAGVQVRVGGDGRLDVAKNDLVLRYTPAERHCFLDGLRNREFTPEALTALR